MAPWLSWRDKALCPKMRCGGFHFPDLADGLYQFAAFRQFDSRRAAFREHAADSSAEDSRGVVRKIHFNRSHSSDRQLTHILVDVDGANKRLLDVTAEVAGQCGVRQAFDKAAHLPLAGTSSAPPLNEKRQVDLLSLSNVIDLRTMDIYPKNSPSVRVCSRHPLVVSGPFAGSRISDSGRPSTIRMYAGGEWGNGIPLDSSTGRNIRLQFQGKGANPWLLGRRNGFARGIYNRRAADGHFSTCATLNEVQLPSTPILGHGGFSASQMAYGSSPADL